MDNPTTSYWMGVPLNELPREELEKEFIIAHRQIRMLEERVCELSVENVKLLAEKARERISIVQPTHRRLAYKIFDLFLGGQRR